MNVTRLTSIMVVGRAVAAAVTSRGHFDAPNTVGKNKNNKKTTRKHRGENNCWVCPNQLLSSADCIPSSVSSTTPT